MPQINLPKIIKGQWIWHTNPQAEDCDRLMLKQDFVLTDMPATAELWIASHIFFNVFINGRPCASGPIPHPGKGNNAFVMSFNVTHMLELGTNCIAIKAHSENTSLGRLKKTINGMWLQLDIDDIPVLWSNEQWLCSRPLQYENTGLRTSPCDVFAESVDCRRFNAQWITAKINELPLAEGNADITSGWGPVDIVIPPSNDYGLLEPFISGDGNTELIPPENIICRGNFELSCQILWFSFKEAITAHNNVLGLYLAECFVYSEIEQRISGLCICDEPYILFVGNQCVKRQAVPSIPMREAFGAISPRPLTPQELESPEIEIKLKPGWNRILFAQNCITNNAGTVIILPDIPPNQLPPYQTRSISDRHGWNLTRPVNTPLSLIFSEFPTDMLPTYHFDVNSTPPADISAFYLAHLFTPQQTETPLHLPQKLKAGEYLICDFGQTRYSFPFVCLEGKSGDKIDVTCGEHLQADEVLTYELGFRRNTSSLILDTGLNRWACSTKKGLRYLMITVREASDSITVKDVQILKETQENSNQGHFQCSSPILENIWQIGANTLDTTVQRGFIDSPTKDQTQYLADAMIQAMAAFYVQGAYNESRWALQAFADFQLDTGELNATSPSGLFQVLPDYSLAWPVWLHKHYLHTGDKEFLNRMMPCLNRLLTYYSNIASTPSGPLDSLDNYLGVYPFIDYGNLERGGIMTGLNAIYCRALRSASWLADQHGDNALSEVYAKRADFIAKAVWRLTWNNKEGLFADAYVNGSQSPQCSWQSNVLALYGGIAKPEHYQKIWDQLFTEDAPLEKQVESDSNNPFFKYFVLETAFALGKNEWALRLIHYYWGRMVQAGATTCWEMFDPQSANQAERPCAKCAGSGVSPNIFLISELVGVRPAEPGMRKIYFNPLPGDINWVKASLPTPHGFIHVHWRMEGDGKFQVNINSNYPLEIIPVLAPGIAETAIFSVGETVTILAPEE